MLPITAIPLGERLGAALAQHTPSGSLHSAPQISFEDKTPRGAPVRMTDANGVRENRDRREVNTFKITVDGGADLEYS